MGVKARKPSRGSVPAGYALEDQARAGGFALVAGVDEAGRGPLAGPVAAAAVILDPGRRIDGLADSKMLDAARREALFAVILREARVGVALMPAAVVDRINIRAATLAAMRAAIAALPIAPGLVLVDGRDVPEGLLCPGRAVIGGDKVSASIAAASIVAKVLRDRMMHRMDGAYPGYGFAQHVGYGAPAHRAAISRLGPCALHRVSFAPFRNGTVAS